MASLNRVQIIGYLGKDPETRFLPNGDAVTNCSIATSESWTDKASGEKKESTEWHKVNFWRRLAEVAGEYLKKGSQVYVEGSLKTRKWQDKDGNDRYTTEITADRLVMLGGKGERKESAEPKAEPKPAAQPSGKAGHFDDMVDDVPF